MKMPFDRQAILDVMDTYITTWNAGDHAQTAACFSFPAMFIASGGVTLLQTERDALDHLDGIRARLKGAGFVRSVWGARDIFPLGDDLALASCEFRRVDGHDKAIESSIGTYTLRRANGGWKIVACVVHGADAKLVALSG
jgi:hypothetical protein